MDAIALLRGGQPTVAGNRLRRGARHRGPAVMVAGAVAMVLCGCGAPAARLEGARQAGRAFEQALAGADYPRACALLAPRTRQQLEEDEHQPCDSALRGQGLAAAGEVRGTQVYGRQALLRLRKDTLFLSQFEDGWKVVTAGCTPQGDKPYRCSLKGG
ncbi:hypothetical protein [Streptomyces melanogenes]|uniref:hypothetical protein n=1 Tax=Streptomyces melanogenes TaxID=67326 RepID=UPI0037A17CF4